MHKFELSNTNVQTTKPSGLKFTDTGLMTGASAAAPSFGAKNAYGLLEQGQKPKEEPKEKPSGGGGMMGMMGGAGGGGMMGGMMG